MSIDFFQKRKDWRTPARRRGTVEIELLLAVSLLLALLFLIGGGLALGRARLMGAHRAAFYVWHDATETSTPQYARDVAPPVSLVREGLPNRLHTAELSENVTVYAGSSMSPDVTLRQRAQLLGPPWTLSAYPAVGDREATERWFAQVADEVRQPFVHPLGLAPACPP